MEDALFTIYVGVVVYGLCSVVIDILLFCLKNLNKKEIGSIGILLNVILFVAASLGRSWFPSDILFYIVCGISVINLIISMVYLLLGMMSGDARY